MSKPLSIGFYGKSNSGKTTILQKLIKIFEDKGYEIASVKITDQKISIDSKEKDTWKHRGAGSNLVVFSSKIETDYMFGKNEKIDEILKNLESFGNFDIVFIEGANDFKTPKIKIGKIKTRKNTIYNYEGDLEKLIELIENKIKEHKMKERIEIKVNGKKIPLTDFPSEFIKNTISAMLSTLKGVEDVETVEIRFKK